MWGLLILIMAIIGVVLSGGTTYYMYTRARTDLSPPKKAMEVATAKPKDVKSIISTDNKPVDCKMSDWSVWSACPTTCGGGEKVRTRQVLSLPSNGGKECEHTVEREACNIQGCPTDCVVGDWTEWSTCSVACGGKGVQSRTRSVLRPSANGGKECPTLMERRTCGSQPCREDCRVSEWGPWSECDKVKAGGKQMRTRKIVQEAVSGGKECPALEQVQPCPEDCETSPWSDWSKCTRTCGGGMQVRTREVTKPGTSGGKECGALAEVKQCNTDACPVDCQVSAWSEWGSCSKTCGGGTQTRTRTTTVPPANGGKACPPLTETQSCNTQACPPPALSLSTNGKCGPENGNTFCPPGQCCSTNGVCGSASDHCYTNRRVDTAYHGKDSPLASLFAPVNCEVSAWSDWSTCDKSCGGGSQTRTRTVTKQPLNGGNACPTLAESQPCNSQACPIDCKEGAWSEWGPCVGGIQTRTRTVQTPAKNGGKDCGPLVETRKCAVDCVMGEWSSWNACDKSCGGGTQTRTREVKTPASNGGAECGPKTETKACNTQGCSENCVTEWSSWGACSKSCGGGTQTRTKVIKTPAKNGGSCPDAGATETVSCNTQACPIDCEMGWTDWGQCSYTCGGGTQTRTKVVKTYPKNGGAACVGEGTTESQDCNYYACPGYNSHDFVQYTAAGTDVKEMSGNYFGCVQECENTPGCIGFSRAKNLGTFDWGTCWLKQKLPNVTWNDGSYQTFMKQGATVPTKAVSLPSYTSHDFVQYTQGTTDVKQLFGSLTDCIKECEASGECLGFTRAKNTSGGYSTCWLKRSWPNITKFDGSYETFMKPGKAVPTQTSATSSTTTSCNKNACNDTIQQYLNLGWGYTSTNFGTCKGCPVVSYPDKV